MLRESYPMVGSSYTYIRIRTTCILVLRQYYQLHLRPDQKRKHIHIRLLI
jgi:hypothetical protein